MLFKLRGCTFAGDACSRRVHVCSACANRGPRIVCGMCYRRFWRGTCFACKKPGLQDVDTLGRYCEDCRAAVTGTVYKRVAGDDAEARRRGELVTCRSRHEDRVQLIDEAQEEINMDTGGAVKSPANQN